MAKDRKARRVLKNPIREILIRVALMGRRLLKIGRNPAHASRVIKEGRRYADHKERRRHWRRWYRVNRKHQRRFGALGGAPGVPHSLSLWMVP